MLASQNNISPSAPDNSAAIAMALSQMPNGGELIFGVSALAGTRTLLANNDFNGYPTPYNFGPGINVILANNMA